MDLASSAIFASLSVFFLRALASESFNALIVFSVFSISSAVCSDIFFQFTVKSSGASLLGKMAKFPASLIRILESASLDWLS